MSDIEPPIQGLEQHQSGGDSVTGFPSRDVIEITPQVQVMSRNERHDKDPRKSAKESKAFEITEEARSTKKLSDAVAGSATICHAEARMQRILIATFLLFVVGECYAQKVTYPQPSPEMGHAVKAPPTLEPGHLKIETMPLNADHLLTLRTFSARDRIQIRQLPGIAMQSSCYTMREYLFSRGSDDSVPWRKGYTSCVAANRFHLREVTPGLDIFPPQ